MCAASHSRHALTSSASEEGVERWRLSGEFDFTTATTSRSTPSSPTKPTQRRKRVAKLSSSSTAAAAAAAGVPPHPSSSSSSSISGLSFQPSRRSTAPGRGRSSTVDLGDLRDLHVALRHVSISNPESIASMLQAPLPTTPHKIRRFVWKLTEVRNALKNHLSHVAEGYNDVGLDPERLKNTMLAIEGRLDEASTGLETDWRAGLSNSSPLFSARLKQDLSVLDSRTAIWSSVGGLSQAEQPVAGTEAAARTPGAARAIGLSILSSSSSHQNVVTLSLSSSSVPSSSSSSSSSSESSSSDSSLPLSSPSSSTPPPPTSSSFVSASAHMSHSGSVSDSSSDSSWTSNFSLTSSESWDFAEAARRSKQRADSLRKRIEHWWRSASSSPQVLPYISGSSLIFKQKTAFLLGFRVYNAVWNEVHVMVEKFDAPLDPTWETCEWTEPAEPASPPPPPAPAAASRPVMVYRSTSLPAGVSRSTSIPSTTHPLPMPFPSPPSSPPPNHRAVAPQTQNSPSPSLPLRALSQSSASISFLTSPSAVGVGVGAAGERNPPPPPRTPSPPPPPPPRSSISAFARLLKDRQSRQTHPNVLSLIGFSPTRPCALSWEQPVGGSLYELLHVKKIRLDIPFALYTSKCIAAGMDHLHRRLELAHPRLSSRAIFIDEERNVKIGRWVSFLPPGSVSHVDDFRYRAPEKASATSSSSSSSSSRRNPGSSSMSSASMSTSISFGARGLNSLSSTSSSNSTSSSRSTTTTSSNSTSSSSSSSRLSDGGVENNPSTATFTPNSRTAKADVYAFALIMWELFVGDHMPFEDYDPASAMAKASYELLRPEISNSVPEIIASFIQRCWQTNPERRPTFQEMGLFFSHIDGQLFFSRTRGGGFWNLEKERETEREELRERRYREIVSFLQSQDCLVNPSELTIGERIGSGSFGKVFEGQWKGFRVAIKRMRNPSSFDLLQFEREVRNIHRAVHPGVVAMFGACLDPPMILLEYMSGGTLYQVLHGRGVRLSVQLALHMAGEIVAGMAYMHGMSILHRDLTTKNVLLDECQNVKISDWGLSVEFTLEMTADGITNPRWRPPEVTRGERDYTKAIDVYSFGLCLWEALTSRVPFAELDGVTACAKACYEGLRPKIPLGCPRDLEIICRRCWAELPSLRPSFANLVTSLKSVQDELARSGTEEFFLEPTDLSEREDLAGGSGDSSSSSSSSNSGDCAGGGDFGGGGGGGDAVNSAVKAEAASLVMNEGGKE